MKIIDARLVPNQDGSPYRQQFKKICPQGHESLNFIETKEEQEEFQDAMKREGVPQSWTCPDCEKTIKPDGV